MVEKDKMYVVRKYVKAKSVSQALKRERSVKVHDIFIDEEWQKKELSEAIGFKAREK